MSNNLKLYNAVRAVPEEAKKPITAGRLKGMTDVEPLWRIKTLTAQFGICGFGWKYEIKRQWLEPAPNGEIAAFSEILLYINLDGKWSEGIPGIGGNRFVAQETKGMHVSDECYKMALTDAISVACKALGIGADVYWGKDPTKYTPSNADAPSNADTPSNADASSPSPPICPKCGNHVKSKKNNDGNIVSAEEILRQLGSCWTCYKSKLKQEAV